MRRQAFLATFLFLLLSSITWSQQLSARITNQDVIDMVGLGLSDDVIIAKIRAASAGGTLQFPTPASTASRDSRRPMSPMKSSR